MAWEIFTPYKSKSTPRAKINVSTFGARLILNKAMASKLGFNSLTKYAKLRYDESRNMMGVSFHQKSDEKTCVVTKVTSNNVDSYSINIENLFESLNINLKNGTYPLTYTRERDILVLALDSLPTTTS